LGCTTECGLVPRDLTSITCNVYYEVLIWPAPNLISNK